MTNTIKACVISELQTELGIKLVIPTDTTTIVPFESEDAAHYFCSIVNSSLFRWCVESFSSAGRGFGSAAILKRIRIDLFDPKNTDHKLLSDLSKLCHEATLKTDHAVLEGAESRVNEVAARLWNITEGELRVISEAAKQ